MRVDFIADLVCPWCYLGWRALKTAAERRPDTPVEIGWRAYQLDPTVPEGGVDRAPYMAARYPDQDRMAAVHGALKAMAAELGAPLDLGAITITPNTNAAHRLIRWAGEIEAQDAAVEALLTAYFVRGEDIGDPIVLADIGEQVGLPRLAVLGRLSDGTDVAVIEAEHETAREAGVTGVPFVVFDGRFGVVGAQSPERYLKAIDKLALSSAV